MATGLLINRADLIKKTSLDGSIDTDKLYQFVEIAQDTHIQNYLGTDLLEVIQGYITAGTLGDAAQSSYLTLVDTYVKPMLIHFTMVEYLPFSGITISNKGTFKHSSENADTAEKSHIDYLVEKHRDIAEHYTQRFIDYIVYNTATYTEYNSNSNGDTHPDSTTNFSGWYLG